MDAMYIKPFIASISNVFSTMMQLPVKVGEPFVKPGEGPSSDVSGIIGMSGDVIGSVVLSFSNPTAENIVALFCGQKYAAGSPDFADAIGELVNMVSGGAKALFKDRKVSISCPSVVLGANHIVAKQSEVPTVVIPCVTDCGTVNIEVSIKDTRAAAANAAGAAAKA